MGGGAISTKFSINLLFSCFSGMLPLGNSIIEISQREENGNFRIFVENQFCDFRIIQLELSFAFIFFFFKIFTSNFKIY